MSDRTLAAVSGSLAALLLCCPGASSAATYQLQVASVPEKVFMHFVEAGTLPRMEAYLETRRSKLLLLRDRQPEAFEFSGPGRSTWTSVSVTLPQRNDPWGALSWDGEPGQVVVFRVRGIQSNYQKLRRVAVLTNGILTRYPVRNTPGSRLRPLAVPATTTGYLARALDGGTFPDWVERRAASYHGLSVIVGRHHNAQESDTVYLFVRMPRNERPYKVILGWTTVRREGVYANIHRKSN